MERAEAAVAAAVAVEAAADAALVGSHEQYCHSVTDPPTTLGSLHQLVYHCIPY
jgi:hypothetical protein